MNTKICGTCKKELPATNEFFSKKSSGKYGLSNKCKECAKEYSKMYRENNKEKVASSNKRWREENEEELKNKRKIKYENNKEVILERNRKYYQENRERVRLQQKKYRIIHFEEEQERNKQYRELHKEKKKLYFKEWARKNPEKVRIKSHRRTAKKAHLPNTLTDKQWELIKTHFDNKCAYCGQQRKLEQDHFIPLSSGGEYTHNNIIPACRTCNASKLDKDFFKWYPTYKYYSKQREKKILEFLNYSENKVQQLALL